MEETAVAAMEEEAMEVAEMAVVGRASNQPKRLRSLPD